MLIIIIITNLFSSLTLRQFGIPKFLLIDNRSLKTTPSTPIYTKTNLLGVIIIYLSQRTYLALATKNAKKSIF